MFNKVKLNNRTEYKNKLHEFKNVTGKKRFLRFFCQEMENSIKLPGFANF